ncbi:MAG: addiction module toxin RelE [Rhodospirillales bacterium]|nr:addiction module toxin RelE [Rhodospirillales bacterium]
MAMRILALGTLRAHWTQPGRADSERSLIEWYRTAETAMWASPADVKATYGNASFVANNRVVFNIAGNKYRLVVAFRYEKQLGFVRFIGTHAEYDEIDVTTI